MKKKVALIFGGKSGEHDVSIKTAFSILKAIDYTKYEVVPVYVTVEGEWLHSSAYKEQPENNERLLDFNSYIELNDYKRFFSQVHVAFPVIHGPNGEDGTLQGMLEIMNIPYVGSSVIGSALGMDKVMMKIVFEQFQLPQGKFLTFKRNEIEENPEQILSYIEHYLKFPVFVKPANLGSSIGISKARNVDELKNALDLAFRFDQKIVVEEMVNGRELEIGVLGHHKLVTSEVGEVTTTKDFYDYEAKYEDQDATNLYIPANVPANVKTRMAELAEKAFHALGCSGLSRVDFFWDESTDNLYINEINTMPGFTPFSMYPMLFDVVGVNYATLIDKLIHLAFEKHQEKERNQITASSDKNNYSFFN